MGTGSALPRLVIDNHMLTEFLDTSDEWISSRTGIRERRVLSDDTLRQIACQASARALDSAGVAAADLDMILCSTVQGEATTPALACMVQADIGANCPAMDVNGACTGFLYALEVAEGLLATGRYRRILIVCAERMTRLCDWRDRSTCVLFGDGAGAVVAEPGDSLLSMRLVTAGDDGPLNAYPHPGNSPYARSAAYRPLYMAGQEIYRFAVGAAAGDLRAAAEAAGVLIDDIGHFVLHQANLRIVEAVRGRLGMPEEKFPHNIERTGNTSSASIPILLDELNRGGALKQGELIAMAAFGAGLTSGACVLRWTQKTKTEA
ncbi:MAG: ketoacyl-ACP synthase III [Clostridiales bacterium]|nr:ketoacyl-ACP synthase III [Clostridiales bacterium]